jgi:hypothetical protein
MGADVGHRETKVYTGEFKLEAVGLMMDRVISYAQVSQAQLRNCVKCR